MLDAFGLGDARIHERRLARCLGLAVLGLWLLLPACEPKLPPKIATPIPDTVLLHVELHAQEATQWCWAATGEMMMLYLGHEVHQCTQATDQGGNQCPCNACQNGALRYGFSSSWKPAALTWSELREQVAVHSTPVGFAWLYDGGGGGHMMVAKGYATTATSNLVSVVNPLPFCEGDTSFIDYEIYRELPGEYTHWRDYYDLAVDP